ncbi:MAG: MmgE/PrpD family protein [Gammaproteobacteria bacterium]|nr:MmgE/PrpD family protein [Gammaproteobacteria bacterium]MYJ51380.1 MmgE/PrpD family protein [Gammaproteobacteria bacterium]
MPAPLLIDLLAEFVQSVSLPVTDSTRKTVRHSVIDTFGCILAGVNEEAPVFARRALCSVSPGSSPIFGTASTAMPETAAFLNTLSGHSLDFDDWEIPGNSHSSVVIVPALFAAAERPLDAQAMIEAYCVGFETIARLGEAVNFEHYAKGWHTTSTLATLGAAAAVCRLWRLDRQQTANALSLGVSRAAGLTRQFGTHAKPLQAAFAAENGIRCARLARSGLTGQSHILEGRQGYLSLTGHGDAGRHLKPFEKLGHLLAIDEYGQVIKPYPSCGYTHRVIDGAIALRNAGIDSGNVVNISIQLPDFHSEILPFTQPQDRREALFSLPYCAAMGLSRGGLGLDDLDSETWQDREVARLISLTTVHPFAPRRPDLNYDPEQPDIVEVETADGCRYAESVAYPCGSSENPLSESGLLEKFRRNAARSRPLDDKKVEALVNWTDCENILDVFNKAGVQHD